MNDRLMRLVKRIAYHPTRAERLLSVDVILQQITGLLRTDKYIMVVCKRTEASGILLAFDPERLAERSDADICQILAHETQHLRTVDLTRLVPFRAPRDWYRGWGGRLLFNVARDLQINDLLLRTGYKKHDALYGLDYLQREVGEHEEIEALMREVAEKFPPPPQDTCPHPEAGELQEAEVVEVEVKTQGGERSAKPASVVPSQEQARWDNFMATVLDLRKSEDRWHRSPKRLSGVSVFASHDAILPRREPLPRKTALMAIDVSDSMDERGVQRICNMVRNSPANYQLTVICFNTEAAEWQNFRKNTEMPIRGGGTAFEAVEAYALSRSRYPDAILCITDGEADIPKVRRPSVWTWVIYGNDAEAFEAQASMRTVELEKVVRR